MNSLVYWGKFGMALGIGWVVFPLSSAAHGVKLYAQSTQGIQIQATYDDGTPMAEAVVSVYAPDAPTTVWLTGTTDRQGYFTFIPDRGLSKTPKSVYWEVKVRRAGHGGVIAIPVTRDDTPTLSPSAVISPLQKVVMTGSILWGCVGTALFFSQRPRRKSEE